MVFIIDNEDNLWVAGDNYDQLELRHNNNVHQLINTNIKVISVSCGNDNTAIIDEDGYLWVTGHNKYGQLGLGNTNNVNQFTNTNIKVISVSCEDIHTIIIDEDNNLWVSGNDYFHL